MRTLARRLGTFDAALIVMGGIVGSGIFRNPSVVAQRMHTAPLIMLVWAIGAVVALMGAFLIAELAARRPANGGLYAYLRDAFHPIVAFAYGWTLLLVSQSGGMAAAAVTFSAYFLPLTGLHWSATPVAAAVLATFTIVNCLGVRQGSSLQNGFMLLKIAAIVALVVAGIFAPSAAPAAAALGHFESSSPGFFAAIGLAIVPVLFTYSGWQTATFVSGEIKDARRTLPRGMILGVVAVAALYLAVNAVCLRVLGEGGLAATTTPASDIARIVLGQPGERVMALIVAISTLGFLSNQILVSPRVYYQMAQDGTFFRGMAKVHPRTLVPVAAIVLQGAAAIAIMLSQGYGQILNYVTSIDDLFFGLAAIALFIFRAQDARTGANDDIAIRMPGHPVTTLLFLAVVWSVVVNLLISATHDTLAGFLLLLSAVPIYFVFRHFTKKRSLVVGRH